MDARPASAARVPSSRTAAASSARSRSNDEGGMRYRYHRWHKRLLSTRKQESLARGPSAARLTRALADEARDHEPGTAVPRDDGAITRIDRHRLRKCVEVLRHRPATPEGLVEIAVSAGSARRRSRACPWPRSGFSSRSPPRGLRHSPGRGCRSPPAVAESGVEAPRAIEPSQDPPERWPRRRNCRGQGCHDTAVDRRRSRPGPGWTPIPPWARLL